MRRLPLSPEVIRARVERRTAREQATRDRNEAAKREIRLGKQRDWIMREHGLSATRFEQLAAQVRGPWKGNLA
jgi:hypothetical protein